MEPARSFIQCGDGDAPPDLRPANMPVCRLRTLFSMMLT